MIDLHLHSTHSDGTDNPVELLKKAEKLGLEVISIADHDSVGAYMELENINVKDYYSGTLIKATELKTAYKSVPIEILGYGIDVNKIQKMISRQVEFQKQVQIEYLEHLKKVARTIGLKFDESVKVDVWAGLTFINAISKTEENKEIMEKYNIPLEGNAFYRECNSNPDNIFYIDESKDSLQPSKIIEEIHEAGGLAFLAHPFMYAFGDFDQKIEIIENFIKEHNIDGLECYYSMFSSEETQKLVEICDKYNLYKSGGSDYHGLNKPYIKMGIGKGSLNISKEQVSEWLNNLIKHK